MSKSFDLSFIVLSGAVQQNVVILDESLSKDDIIEGLNTGKFATTLYYTQGESNYIVNLDNNHRVAEIIYSETDAEYVDFEAE